MREFTVCINYTKSSHTASTCLQIAEFKYPGSIQVNHSGDYYANARGDGCSCDGYEVLNPTCVHAAIAKTFMRQGGSKQSSHRHTGYIGFYYVDNAGFIWYEKNEKKIKLSHMDRVNRMKHS